MTNKNEIKLAIFDLGNVVFKVSWKPMFEYWETLTQISAKTLIEKFYFDKDFEKFEKNQISSKDFYCLCDGSKTLAFRRIL